jgi:hypothetical protein
MDWCMLRHGAGLACCVVYICKFVCACGRWVNAVNEASHDRYE